MTQESLVVIVSMSSGEYLDVLFWAACVTDWIKHPSHMGFLKGVCVGLYCLQCLYGCSVAIKWFFIVPTLAMYFELGQVLGMHGSNRIITSFINRDFLDFCCWLWPCNFCCLYLSKFGKFSFFGVFCTCKFLTVRLKRQFQTQVVLFSGTLGLHLSWHC